MSRYRILIPRMFSYWWENLERQHRLFDQRFTVRSDHFFPSTFDRSFDKLFSETFRRPWDDLVRDDESGWSAIKNDKDKFHVSLDVQQFKPNEINVKVIDNVVVVEGKHEEKEDEHGMVSQHFIRKYMVPEQCNAKEITSTLSSDGVLTIIAPKLEAVEGKKEKVINIKYTGKPEVED